MLTRHIIPQNQKTPSKGILVATIGTSPPLTFTADGFNFARDYYTTDRKMRLTLSALQRVPNMIHGIEITFPSTLASGTHTIESGAACAVYWQLLVENGESIFYTYDADSGFLALSIDEAGETFQGSVYLRSHHADGTFLEIKDFGFNIEGRDDLTL